MGRHRRHEHLSSNTPCPTAPAPTTCSATAPVAPWQRIGSQARWDRPDQRPRPRARHYAAQLDVPFAFLSNGEEVWFLDRDTDAHARQIAGFYSQDDLERRTAARGRSAATWPRSP